MVSFRRCSGACPYDVLGLRPTASREQIRERYLERARALHPDVAGASEAGGTTMAAINEAYNALVDPTKRAELDAARANRAEQQVALCATVDALLASGACGEALAHFCALAPNEPHPKARAKLCSSARALLRRSASTRVQVRAGHPRAGMVQAT